MRNAATVLGIIRERGRRGLPLEDVYRQLFNPDLYLRAYGRIAPNKGTLTPGATPETADGMSRAKVDAIIAAVRCERYRWTPVRRTYLPKKNGKQRPLGIPTWSDKLLQEVIRSLLEAYYEPQFSRHSHGFRPGLGCHSALGEIYRTWKGTVWLIEGDITKCFDTLDHQVLLSILREKIRDNRFVRLIAHLLQAGYLEEWKLHATRSGTPQGGVVSPILANIYLDRLDHFVERTLLPAHNRGIERSPNPTYEQMRHRALYLRKLDRRVEARALRQQMQRLPSRGPNDPDYRRLRYVRYADDWLLGFVGPRHEAEEIKRQLGEFLRDTLKLELSNEKTLITHARTGAARFLGYEIASLHSDTKRDHSGQRSINGQIGLKVPLDVVRRAGARYRRGAKPMHRQELTHNAVYDIVVQFQTTYRGLVQYYQLAYNLHRFQQLKWIMEQSLTKTLALKLRLSVRQVYERYHATLQTDHGPAAGLRVTVERGGGQAPLIAVWGGVSLRRQQEAVLNDHVSPVHIGRSELVQRLLADTCELCDSKRSIQVHHIRALSDLRRPGRPARPAWVEVMAARRRKTLIVCHACHTAIHSGRSSERQVRRKTLESRVR